MTPEGIAKRGKITVDFWKGITLLLRFLLMSRCQTYPIADEEGF